MSGWRMFLLMALFVGGVVEASEPIRHQVEVEGHPFTVWEKSADRAEQAVLLLHGRTWSSLPDFDLRTAHENLSLMDDLVTAGFAVYALDQRGYGQTRRDSSGWLEPDTAADDVAAVLRWINNHSGLKTRPALFGWSMGSTTGWLTAQKYPDQVSHLVLYGCWWNPARPIPVSDAPEKPERQPTTREAAAEDFKIPGSISKQAIKTFVDAAVGADPVRADWRHLHQYNALDASKLTMPVLLLHGEADPYVSVEAHTAIFNSLGTANREWVVIANGDHAVHLEKARDRFNHALISFLKRP